MELTLIILKLTGLVSCYGRCFSGQCPTATSPSRSGTSAYHIEAASAFGKSVNSQHQSEHQTCETQEFEFCRREQEHGD